MRCESVFGGRRSTDMGMIAGVVLTFAVFMYMFWPDKNPFVQADKTRVDYLRERKDAIYENLRDLNFEYQAGKYPEQDYQEQRTGGGDAGGAGANWAEKKRLKYCRLITQSLRLRCENHRLASCDDE